MCGRSHGKGYEHMSDTPIEGVDRTTSAVCECESVISPLDREPPLVLTGGPAKLEYWNHPPPCFGIGNAPTGTKPTKVESGTQS